MAKKKCFTKVTKLRMILQNLKWYELFEMLLEMEVMMDMTNDEQISKKKKKKENLLIIQDQKNWIQKKKREKQIFQNNAIGLLKGRKWSIMHLKGN